MTLVFDFMCIIEPIEGKITEKRSHLLKKKCIFLQDNAAVHKSIKTVAKGNELRFELLPHPSYSLDLASSDLYLFPNSKK